MLQDGVERPQDRIDARSQSLPVPSRRSSPSQIHNGSHRGCLGKQSQLTEAKLSRVQNAHRVLELDFLEHLGFEGHHRRLRDIAPHIVAEEEEAILVNVGLGYVEVAPN